MTVQEGVIVTVKKFVLVIVSVPAQVDVRGVVPVDAPVAVVAADVQIALVPVLHVLGAVVVLEHVRELVLTLVQENATLLVQQKRRQKSLPILERILLSAT